MRRLAEADLWSMDAVMRIKALPRRPNPNTGERDPAPRRPQDRSGQEDDREDGADLGDPDCSDALGGPREMRTTSRLLDKYGYTDGCLGCAHKQAGLYDHRQHSTVCRTRIYDFMKDDKDELDKIQRIEARLGRIPPRHEQIRRGAGPLREAADAAPSTSHGGAGPGSPDFSHQGTPDGLPGSRGTPDGLPGLRGTHDKTEAAEQEASALRQKPNQKRTLSQKMACPN